MTSGSAIWSSQGSIDWHTTSAGGSSRMAFMVSTSLVPKVTGQGPQKPACVKIEVFLPVFVGLIGVEAAFEIQIEFIVERFPRVGVAGAV